MVDTGSVPSVESVEGVSLSNLRLKSGTQIRNKIYKKSKQGNSNS